MNSSILCIIAFFSSYACASASSSSSPDLFQETSSSSDASDLVADTSSSFSVEQLLISAESALSEYEKKDLVKNGGVHYRLLERSWGAAGAHAKIERGVHPGLCRDGEVCIITRAPMSFEERDDTVPKELCRKIISLLASATTFSGTKDTFLPEIVLAAIRRINYAMPADVYPDRMCTSLCIALIYGPLTLLTAVRRAPGCLTTLPELAIGFTNLPWAKSSIVSLDENYLYSHLVPGRPDGKKSKVKVK